MKNISCPLTEYRIIMVWPPSTELFFLFVFYLPRQNPFPMPRLSQLYIMQTHIQRVGNESLMFFNINSSSTSNLDTCPIYIYIYECIYVCVRVCVRVCVKNMFRCKPMRSQETCHDCIYSRTAKKRSQRNTPKMQRRHNSKKDITTLEAARGRS